MQIYVSEWFFPIETNLMTMEQPPGYFKPTRQQIEDAQNSGIEDVLGKGIKLLLCGINSGLYTAAIGKHLSGPQASKNPHTADYQRAGLLPVRFCTQAGKLPGALKICGMQRLGEGNSLFSFEPG